MNTIQTHGRCRTGNPGHIFWGEMAPCEHLVQFYENDSVFISTLESFVRSGIDSGDSVILIATDGTLKAIDQRMSERGVSLKNARRRNQYVALEAKETLSKFVVNGWPDDELFKKVITEVIDRSRGDGRKVRAFGEMVAVLWAEGKSGATVRLEYLWHRLCEKEVFSLLCAYPKSGFTQDAEASMKEICDAHSRVIPGASAA